MTPFLLPACSALIWALNLVSANSLDLADSKAMLLPVGGFVISLVLLVLVALQRPARVAKMLAAILLLVGLLPHFLYSGGGM